LIEDIVKDLSASQSFVLLEYKGLTVAEDTDMRNEFRKSGVKYKVYKNTLLKRALNQLGYAEYDGALSGPTSIAMGMKDITSAARISYQKMNDVKKITVKCGMAEKSYLSEAECKSLAELPSKEVIAAKLIGMIQSPLSALVRVLDSIAQKLAPANN
jgi:Ribosomal protein L10